MTTWPFDAGAANVARVYDAMLGGKDNFEADREAVRVILEAVPTALTDVRENREFLGRSVTWLAHEAGIRQFLDIGAGLPARDNTHEIAQRAARDTRVVYVDADEVVCAHARALLANSDPADAKTVHVVGASLLDPAGIIRQAQDYLDFTQPVAVLLVAILHFIEDAADPWTIVKNLLDAVPAGSYLVISHATEDGTPGADGATAALQKVYAASAAGGVTPRTRADVLRFFDGMDMAEPGLVDVADWHQHRAGVVTHFHGCAARKPEADRQVTA